MLRVPLEALSAGDRLVDHKTARYLTRVHRLERGAQVLVFDPGARLEAEAKLVETGRRVLLCLGDPRPARAVPSRAIRVIQGASKGTKIDDVLRDATELGAMRFVIAVCERSVKRPQGGQEHRWRRIAIEAARQCGRGDIPEIVGPLSFSEAVANDDGALRLILDPTGESLGEWPSAARQSTTIAIGPEGGFSQAERDAAARAGFRAVALGQFVLRTETACAAALGAVLTR